MFNAPQKPRDNIFTIGLTMVTYEMFKYISFSLIFFLIKFKSKIAKNFSRTGKIIYLKQDQVFQPILMILCILGTKGQQNIFQITLFSNTFLLNDNKTKKFPKQIWKMYKRSD